MEKFSPCSLMPDGYLDKCVDCVKRDKTMVVEDYLPSRKPPVVKRKPTEKKPRGRPKLKMPSTGNIKEPEGGAERRKAWIEAHKQKGFGGK